MKTIEKNKTALDILKPEHRMFVAEYVACAGNGTEAYMKAYPKAKYNTARANAPKLLALTCISEAIEIQSDKYWKDKDKEIEKSKTYRLIHFCGDVDIADIFTNEYDVKPLNEIPLTARLAIQSIKKTEKITKYGTDKTVEVTLVNKLSALQLRATMQGMLSDKSESDDMIITVGLAVRPDRMDDDY